LAEELDMTGDRKKSMRDWAEKLKSTAQSDRSSPERQSSPVVPSPKSSEEVGSPAIPYVLVPVGFVNEIVRQHDQLVQTCLAQWEALNDILDRIASQDAVDKIHLGGWDALNDIASRIRRLRAGAPMRSTEATSTRTLEVRGWRDSAANVADNLVAGARDHFDGHPGPVAYRIVISVAKELLDEAGALSTNNFAGAPS